MVVMPNPVISFPPSSVTGKKKIILNVGRYDPQKDQKTLIESFALLSPKFPEWQLRIVGEGELRPELEAQIQALGLQDKIFLTGKNPAIEDEYAQAEIFVMPSLYESFGLVTAEAMSFKLPAIGFSDCPGTNEIIVNDVNGLLIDPKSRIHSLVMALKKLMSDEDYRKKLGDRGPESIHKYQPSAIATLWESLIAQAL